MDRLKQQGKWAKFIKNSFRNPEETADGTWKYSGSAHIKQSEYGVIYDEAPYTNRYVKKVKEELKKEYRAVKRSEKQAVRKEIEEILLEDSGV
jgi:hypothetical protein